MEAGRGADDQAKRYARRLEELRAEHARSESAEALNAAARAEEQVRRWSAGAEGERQVADSIAPLAAHGWTALHDIRWPGRPKANIDHVALGPGGVVVIDAKNWGGSVTARSGELRQNGYRRTDEVESVADATAALTALLAPEHRTAVRGALCLTGHNFESMPTPSGITVVGLPKLLPYLDSLPARLSPYDVADIGRLLAHQLDSPPHPKPARRSRSPRGTATERYRPAQRKSKSSRRRHPILRALLVVVASLWVLGVVSSMLSSLTYRADPSFPQPSVPATHAPAVPADPPAPADPATPGAPAS